MRNQLGPRIDQDCLGGQIDGVDDSVLDEIEDFERENKDEVKPLTILNTNARSLCPKIDSLIDCMDRRRRRDLRLKVVPQ